MQNVNTRREGLEGAAEEVSDEEEEKNGGRRVK